MGNPARGRHRYKYSVGQSAAPEGILQCSGISKKIPPQFKFTSVSCRAIRPGKNEMTKGEKAAQAVFCERQ
jgi:hypothetical protein